MLDASGGSGGTSWATMDVPSMWSMIANQETAPHWEMLKGWRRSYELVLQHMSQVKNYRDNLAAAWPPEKSRASAAYLVQLDVLLDSLQETYDAAVTNYTAFSTATLSLSTTRTQLKQIYDQYTSNQTKLDEFNAQPNPVQYGKAPLPPRKPPVADNEQEALTIRARALMAGFSTELVQAKMSIVSPTAYRATPGVTQDPNELDNQGFVPPPPPPIVSPQPGAAEAGRPGPSLQGQSSQASNTSSSPHQPGLVLGGAHPPAPPPGGNLNSPPNPPQLNSPTTTSPGPLPGGVGPFPTPSNGRTGTSNGQLGLRGPIGMQPSTVRPGVPGGIIGAVPGTPPAPTRGPSSRVNPVGGVIGAPNQLAQGRIGTNVPGLVGGQPQMGDASPESKRWDPDNPWQTVSGVPPVLLPTPERPIDPGPAIGLT